ncbi:MAG: hypothetical protein ACK5PP_18835 [Acidimicrobiales bacterium]
MNLLHRLNTVRRPTGSDGRRLIIVGLLVAALAVTMAGARFAAEIERSRNATEHAVIALNEVESLGRPLDDRITWLETTVVLDRVPTEAVLRQVRADWADAWHTLDTLSSGGSVTDPQSTLGGAVLQRVSDAPEPAATLSVHQVSHQLRVDFFSLDGTTIGLFVPSAESETVIDRGPGMRPLRLRTVAAYTAVMELMDGRWHLTVLDTAQPPDTVPEGVEKVQPAVG